MNGVIGLHVEANSSGYSRDRAVEAARLIGGGIATIVNDPQLCMMLLDVGVIPIHRINRKGLEDDNAHQRDYSVREYVRTAAREAPDPRVLIYLNNEPGQQDLARLNAWVLEGIDEANRLGRTLVAFNWSYGNPEAGAWDVLAPAARALAAGGHYLGVHEGTDIQHPTLDTCFPHRIGRFIEAQRRFGFPVIVTEFAASRDAYNGWQTWDSHYAEAAADTVRRVYAPRGVFMTPFTLFEWKYGFDYINSSDLMRSFAQTNQLYPVEENPMALVSTPTLNGAWRQVTALPPGIVWRNIRAQPDANAQDVGDLRAGELVYAFTSEPTKDNWVYLIRPESPVAGWVLWTGVVTAPAAPAQSGNISADQVRDLESAGTTIARVVQEVMPSVSDGGF